MIDVALVFAADIVSGDTENPENRRRRKDMNLESAKKLGSGDRGGRALNTNPKFQPREMFRRVQVPVCCLVVTLGLLCTVSMYIHH